MKIMNFFGNAKIKLINRIKNIWMFNKTAHIGKISERATEILQDLYGKDAKFREGQYEAIKAVLTNKRTLVVQKTGWGKSLVYFICAKILRENQRGITFVISPLIVLIENQFEAAKAIGLNCDVLNSVTKDRRDNIICSILNNELDLAFITPETLFSEDIQSIISKIDIGLIVIDEAHCISDWGHDFRLDYSNIYKVLANISSNVPVLATTATANNRVIKDLKKQLGGRVYILRGPLLRKTLSIQILKLPNKAQRYGWILQNINKLPGSGIIYCLTQRDCDYLTDFLIQNGINVRSYYSRNKNSDHLNREAEILFRDNKIKAIVSTIKLGMGYDKGDISFIIHFQQPSNIEAYYQQIGRAGRNIERAYAFLMCGSEDKKIQDYFIKTAFPFKNEAYEIWKYIYDNTDRGVLIGNIADNVNIRKDRIDKVLAFLINEGSATKKKGKYYATIKRFKYNGKHYNKVTSLRYKEQNQMLKFVDTKKCYGKFIANCLDDHSAKNCGICANCLGYEEYSSNVNLDYVNVALNYIERNIVSMN